MEVGKSIFLKAFVITLIIFASVYSLNVYLNSMREESLDERMAEILEDFEEMQALTTMMRVFGENASCIALETNIKLLDTKIWKMGEKIDSYRELTREYMNDPYYNIQKKKFNRQEVIYLSLLKEMKQQCDMNQTEILYFYRRSEFCPDCDKQSYVLNYFNQKIDPEIAVFSFDADLDLPSVNVLLGIYNVTEYPCVVVGDRAHCSLLDREQMTEILCSTSNLSICD
ncbi:MAG: hypothetical protein ABIH11_01220 [Candidatus Altiarchaeota archaeon]